MNKTRLKFSSYSKEQLSQRLSRLRVNNLWEPNFDCSTATSITEALLNFQNGHIEQHILTFGRVVKLHNFGKLVFGQLRHDLSEMEFLLTPIETSGFLDIKQELQLGDIISIRGKTGNSKRNYPQILANEIKIISPCFISHFPENNDPKRIYVGMTTQLNLVAKQKMRSLILWSLRRFLEKENFEEQFSPIMTKAFYGGRSHPFRTHYRSENRDMYLRVTAEIALRMLITGGLSRIYEIGPSFRNETRDSMHISPFMLLEAYAPYTSYLKMLYLCERLLVDLFISIDNKFGDWLRLWNVIELDHPHFTHVSSHEIIKKVLDIDISYENGLGKLAQLCENEKPIDNSQKAFLIYKALKNFVFPKLVEPTIVTDLPTGLSPFIQNDPNDPSKLNRAYFIIRGIQIAEVFEGQSDPSMLLEALEVQDQNKPSDDIYRDYTDLSHSILFGIPPISVLDISIERLMMVCCNEKDVRNTILEL